MNVVCPGARKTAIIDSITGNKKEVEKQFSAMEPIVRLGQPEEVANAGFLLYSNVASIVTGHAKAVNEEWVAEELSADF